MSSQALLSIGMIVKNEIRCIEKCLKALQPLRDTIPCQLVIADTGSTDGTREIAEKYADILFDFEWINDFAAARNAVLDHCVGKWYMTVDADEYLVPELDELVSFLAGPQADIYDYARYIQRNHTSLDMKGLYGDFYAMRMARMHPKLRYQGAIHEGFVHYETSKITNLGKTVFDHDGYAAVTPDHMKKKCERNLALLEPLLEEDPHNLRRLTQCIESSCYDKTRQLAYVRRGMEELFTRQPGSDFNWKFYAPSLAKHGVILAASELFSETDAWYQWAIKAFPNNFHLKIDGNHFYLVYLHKKERYHEMLPIGKAYLDAVQQYEKSGPEDDTVVSGECYCVHPAKVNEMRTLLAEAYFEEGKKRQPVNLLEAVELENLDTESSKRWFSLFERMVAIPSARKVLHRKLLPFYENRNTGVSGRKNLWLALRAYIEQAFSAERKNENEICALYKGFPGTIGICAELVDAKTTEEAQALLGKVEDWENLMPLALMRALELDCTLPDGFYHVTPERLRDFCLVLANHWKGTAQYALQSTAPEQITDWHQLSFSYDLLCAICMNKDCFEGDYGEALSDRLAQVGALFLQNCYRPNLLEDEEAVDRLPPLHRFSWHFARAVTAKQDNDWAGYMRALRAALKTAELMKDFVGHLMNDIDIEDIKRRELIAAAPSELRELAEKVKILLAQYPADDPSVIVLKQTPVYQKVAYMIEDTHSTEC